MHCLAATSAASRIDRVVLVAPEEFLEQAAAAAGHPEGLDSVLVVSGGATRQESVWRGLEAMASQERGSASIVVCHDAARPFASPALFDRVVDAVGGEADMRGAVPAVRSPDTVKRVSGGAVVETLPRDEIALVQTPQAFDVVALREAHVRGRELGVEATDDAMLLEAAGFAVAVVEGEAANFKITTADDLRRAEQYLASGRR